MYLRDTSISTRAAVTLSFALDTIGHITKNGTAIRVRFQFDDSDPFAINITFDNEGDNPVLWSVSRELMSLGVQHPQGTYGEGDVVLKGDNVTFDICIRSTNEAITITFARREIRRFMRKVNRRLPIRTASAIVHQQLDKSIPHVSG